VALAPRVGRQSETLFHKRKMCLEVGTIAYGCLTNRQGKVHHGAVHHTKATNTIPHTTYHQHEYFLFSPYSYLHATNAGKGAASAEIFHSSFSALALSLSAALVPSAAALFSITRGRHVLYLHRHRPNYPAGGHRRYRTQPKAA
jgi:hypothetical protein